MKTIVVTACFLLAICTGSTVATQCGFAEYDCNSVCLPFTTMCDGIVDCVGGELQDEDPFLCADCAQGSINCQDGQSGCISTTNICNGVSDCSTGIDESVCTRPSTQPNCSNSEYLCNSTCLSYTTICDGVQDCVLDSFASDESESICSGCPTRQINCQNSSGTAECVSNTAICNGIVECSTGFDEDSCNVSDTTETSFTPTECPEGSSPCLTNRFQCINNTLFCNGIADCMDQSDEYLCSCDSGFLKCDPSLAPSDTNCVSLAGICNGVLDCPGDSPLDESVCGAGTTGSCQTTEVQCPASDVCVTSSALCNSQADCPISGVDESPIVCGCPRNTQIPFQCDNFLSVCLERSQICDGTNDCSSGSDESAEICPSADGVTLSVANPDITVLELDVGQNYGVVSTCFQATVLQPLDREAIFGLFIANLTTTASSGYDFYPNISVPDVIIPIGFSGDFFGCIDIIIVGDDVAEDDELVVYDVRPFSENDRVLSPERVTIRIIDNDGVTLRLLSTSDAILESSDGTRVICIELVRVGGGLERTVSVALNFIEEGYATRSDFMTSGNPFNFPPSSIVGASECVTFAPVHDDIPEVDEVVTFEVVTLNDRDLFDSDRRVSFTIIDDDGYTGSPPTTASSDSTGSVPTGSVSDSTGIDTAGPSTRVTIAQEGGTNSVGNAQNGATGDLGLTGRAFAGLCVVTAAALVLMV